MAHLPPSGWLNINALSKLFDDTTNSYKHLLFLSILTLLKESNFPETAQISYRDLVVGMMTLAWEPCHKGLSFGSQDKVREKIRQLDLSVDKPLFLMKDFSSNKIRSLIKSRVNESSLELMKYPPYRLIRPFFEEETKGVPDSKVNSLISILAQEEFLTTIPLYYLDEDEQTIILHEEWIRYFRIHCELVEKWAFSEWEAYLHKRNPGYPNDCAILLGLLALVSMRLVGLPLASWQLL